MKGIKEDRRFDYCGRMTGGGDRDVCSTAQVGVSVSVATIQGEAKVSSMELENEI